MTKVVAVKTVVFPRVFQSIEFLIGSRIERFDHPECFSQSRYNYPVSFDIYRILYLQAIKVEKKKNENVTRNVANTLNQPTQIIFY